jgi:hypothetical protein
LLKKLWLIKWKEYKLFYYQYTSKKRDSKCYLFFLCEFNAVTLNGETQVTRADPGKTYIGQDKKKRHMNPIITWSIVAGP